MCRIHAQTHIRTTSKMSGSWNSHVVVSGEHFEESKTPSDENACNTITVVKISDVNETEYAQGTRSKTLALPSNSREGVTPKCKESGNDSAREEESHVRDTLCYRNDVTDKHQSNALDVSVRLESGEFSGGGVQARTSFPDCSTSHDPSENLISRNSNTEQFTEKNDDVFPSSPPKSKSSSTDDLLDKNFVKWKNGGNSKRGGRGKDSTESESPSSDFEFSACSSVTSCTEDSGISSTVRDDELEEIPLNSSQFSPELYKQMSRFCVDNMVVSWVPQSSNTYAPCPNSNMKTVSSAEGRRSDESAQKHSKLKWEVEIMLVSYLCKILLILLICKRMWRFANKRKRHFTFRCWELVFCFKGAVDIESTSTDWLTSWCHLLQRKTVKLHMQRKVVGLIHDNIYIYGEFSTLNTEVFVSIAHYNQTYY